MSGQAKTPEREAERRRKISESRKQKHHDQGFLNSAETRQKLSLARKGRKLSEAHIEALASSHRGKPRKHLKWFRDFQEKGWATSRNRPEEKHPRWLGDDAGYSAIHNWVRKHKGAAPRKCDECGDVSSRRYEWANVSGEYRRELDDYRSLCVSCHRKEGYARGEYVPWNKGLRISSFRETP